MILKIILWLYEKGLVLKKYELRYLEINHACNWLLKFQKCVCVHVRERERGEIGDMIKQIVKS